MSFLIKKRHLTLSDMFGDGRFRPLLVNSNNFGDSYT